MDQVANVQDNIVFEDQHPGFANDKAMILQSLGSLPRRLDPKYFYDRHGSALFQAITQTPEYYPTRTEHRILKDNAAEIAEYCGQQAILIEPGSGACEKVRLLLDDLRPASYVPLDISAEFLRHSSEQLACEYPWLHIHAICADFSHDWSLPDTLGSEKRVVFYPGSTIGNLEPGDALHFLKDMRDWAGEGGGILIGVDLHKDSDILNAAYNDSEGLTEAFNLNILEHVNQIADANFDRDNFLHRAFYNERLQRIEMHLESLRRHRIRIGDKSFVLEPGETIHTENSYKYSSHSFRVLAQKADLDLQHSWIDEGELFSVHYLAVA